MTLDLGTLLQLLGTVGPGVGLYVAIRTDLARLHERTAATAKTADHAHERIDAIMMKARP